MSGFEKLGREYLRDLLGEEPVYPVTHPRGPRGIEQLDHAPLVERELFEEEEQPPGRCILRRSCGRSCYCAKAGAEAIVEEMRRRHGPWWPAEPPMLVGRVRYSPEVEEDQAVRRLAKQQGITLHVNQDSRVAPVWQRLDPTTWANDRPWRWS